MLITLITLHIKYDIIDCPTHTKYNISTIVTWRMANDMETYEIEKICAHLKHRGRIFYEYENASVFFP